MMNTRISSSVFKKIGVLASLLFISNHILYAHYFATPLTAPDESRNFLPLTKDATWAVGVSYEENSARGCFNGSDRNVPLGQMYNDGESFLTMLRQAQGTVATLFNNGGILYPNLDTMPSYGNTRGVVDITGRIYQKQVMLSFGTNLQLITIIPGSIDCALYIPFVVKHFDSVNLQTRRFDAVDFQGRQLQALMHNTSAFVQQYGNLNTDPWQGGGMSDPALIIRWKLPQEFVQETVREVNPYLYFGITMPFTNHRNEDQLFSLPLGNDGHWGIPFGLGVDFTFDLPIKMGLALDMLFLIPESFLMRAQTDPSQTSLLLLNKTRIRRTPGLTWRLNWFTQAERLWYGLGCSVGYEFIMHHNDTLSTRDAGFSLSTINGIGTAQNWYLSLVSAAIKYDFGTVFDNAGVKPGVELKMKFPVSGRRAINASSVSVALSVGF